jgi:predicted TIM-barrel fold metal-dependent hydrolase
MNKLMIISADGHAAPSLATYRPYLEEKYLADFDAMLRDVNSAVTTEFFNGFLNPEVESNYKSRVYDSGAIAGQWDAGRRLKELAADGVVGEVLFPDGAPFSAGGLGSRRTKYAPDLERAGGRAYNRWLADFVDGHPGLGAQAIVSLADVDEAVKDVYWAKEHGFKAIFAPGMDQSQPLYWDPMYDPFWAACADTGLPLNFHGGTGQPKYDEHPVDGVPMDVRLRVSGIEFAWWARRPLHFLILSGVLERFSDLRVIFTEQHCDWVAGLMAQLDHSWHNSMLNDSLKQIVPRPPSEYFRRQVFIGASLLARGEVITRDQIGADRMMFGVDFPHPEGTWGTTRDYLRATVGAAQMSEPEIRAFLGGTAAEVFGFDAAALQARADEVGLGLDEVTGGEIADSEAEEEKFRYLDVFRPTVGLTPLH